MSRIFVITGKSATGKDTVYKSLENMEALNLKTVVIYTTRPIREGEENGREYFFVSEDRLKEYQKGGKVIEHREYPTIHGSWHYFTVNDGQIDLTRENYLIIGTLESYQQMKEYYGDNVVVPIYIEVEDGLRLERALNRERQQKFPRYAEMCRRFLADEEDFSEENLKKAGILKRYQNHCLEECLKQIGEEINAGLR